MKIAIAATLQCIGEFDHDEEVEDDDYGDDINMVLT